MAAKKKKQTTGTKFVQQLKIQRKKKFFDIPQATAIAERNHRSGNLKLAEDGFREILSVDPKNLNALYKLGIIAHQTGRVSEGIQLFQKTISLHPDFPFGYNSLGVLLEHQRDLETAIKCYNKAITIKPDFADAYYNLGCLYMRKGSPKKAIENFARALTIAPDNIELKTHLADACHLYGDLERSISCYNEVLSLTDSPIIHIKLGNVWREKREPDAAITSYRKAIALQPANSEAHYNLGSAYKNVGQFDRAADSFSQAIKCTPDFGDAHRSLSALTKYSPGDEHISLMESLLLKKNLSDEDRMHITFALAKAYDDTGSYKKSFAFLSEGNSLRRSTYTYSSEETVRLVDRIKHLFDNLQIAPPPDNAPQHPTPIFILGMPRSGTSLVEQILASHDDVYGAGELSFLKRSILTLTDEGTLKAAIEKIICGGWQLIDRLQSEYTEKFKQFSFTEKYVTDKMPHNFLLIGFIHCAMPRAKIIHCTRDPMDTCFSIFQHFFGGRHPYAYNLTELGEYYLLYADIMQYWHNTFPRIMHTVNYEQLLNNQEEETRKLLDYCALPWQNACLEFYTTQRSVSTASDLQVRKPLYKSSMGKWKRYEKELQPLFDIISRRG